MPHTSSLRARVLTLAATASLIATPVTIRAQGASVHPVPPPVATAARRNGSITIDGRIDEAAWAQATPITDFRQYQPNEGAPASVRSPSRTPG